MSSRVPDATLVRGYEAWRAAGRQVNRDEKGIEIFSRMRRREPGLMALTGSPQCCSVNFPGWLSFILHG